MFLLRSFEWKILGSPLTIDLSLYIYIYIYMLINVFYQSVMEYEEHEKRAWSVDFSRTEPSRLVSGSDDCKVLQNT